MDELAHTNVPGSTHQKRYEDVIELLGSGISVISAVNIQHIESLNDAIASTTGVRVRETIPDWVLKRADEVVNVDVSIETLRDRLRQGKIYEPAKIEQALSNFFRKGNLTALRELALRQLATDQAGKAQAYRDREGLERPVIPEKVMVAMASRGSARTLLRVGSRIAGRLASDWYAVYVETPKEEPGRIVPQDHVALADNIRFAQQLGAKVVKLKRSKVADALVEFAKREGITHVIFGQSARSRWDLLMHGSIVDRFLRDVRNATVQIVPMARGGRRPKTPWAADGTHDETAHEAAARLFGIHPRARPAGRVERAHAQPDERRVAADHFRELRLGRRCAGHEGKPGAAGLGRGIRAARRARAGGAAGSRASRPVQRRARQGGGEHHRGRRARNHRGDQEAAATTTTGASTSSCVSRGDRTALYFRDLEPRFNAVRADCDRLLHLNQEAMRRKADRASGIARRWYFITLGLALTLMIVGVAVEFSLSNAIVGPVRQLTDATTRVAAGDLDAAVPVQSGDEIGALANGFNRMAERIRELRRSDLGKLLVAQQTTEAAIDSLYDPVVVTDSDGRVTRINAAAERLFGARAETRRQTD